MSSFSDFLKAVYQIGCDRCQETRQTQRAFVKHLGRYHRIPRWWIKMVWEQWKFEMEAVKEVRAILGPVTVTGSYA